jgi:hypothetical protein
VKIGVLGIYTSPIWGLAESLQMPTTVPSSYYGLRLSQASTAMKDRNVRKRVTDTGRFRVERGK